MIKTQALLEIAHVGELYSQMIDDVAKCLAWIDVLDDQFSRRQYVRSAFALVEAATYRMKQIVYAFHQQGDCSLEAGEADLLAEVTYSLRKDGKVVSSRRSLPTVGNIRFALDKFAQHSAPGYSVNWSDHGWSEFQKALDLRHRLTHPKGLNDLGVSDKELDIVKQGFEWYRLALMGAFHHGSELHRKRFEELTGQSIEEPTNLGGAKSS